MDQPVLKLGIPNNSSLKYSVFNGLLAVLILLAVAIGVHAVVTHHATFKSHYFMWSMLGITVLLVCVGWALIFMEEALMKEKSQIQLTDESLKIGNDRFVLNMIRKVAVVVTDQQGNKQEHDQPVHGCENSLVLYTSEQQTIPCSFSLNTSGELESLERILKTWRTQGVNLVTDQPARKA